MGHGMEGAESDHFGGNIFMEQNSAGGERYVGQEGLGCEEEIVVDDENERVRVIDFEHRFSPLPSVSEQRHQDWNSLLLIRNHR